MDLRLGATDGLRHSHTHTTTTKFPKSPPGSHGPPCGLCVLAWVNQATARCGCGTIDPFSRSRSSAWPWAGLGSRRWSVGSTHVNQNPNTNTTPSLLDSVFFSMFVPLFELLDLFLFEVKSCDFNIFQSSFGTEVALALVAC